MQASDWVMVLVLIFLIKFGEKKEHSSLNFKKFDFATIILELCLGGFFMLYIAAQYFI